MAPKEDAWACNLRKKLIYISSFATDKRDHDMHWFIRLRVAHHHAGCDDKQTNIIWRRGRRYRYGLNIREGLLEKPGVKI
jgi:hypothetical protein